MAMGTLLQLRALKLWNDGSADLDHATQGFSFAYSPGATSDAFLTSLMPMQNGSDVGFSVAATTIPPFKVSTPAGWPPDPRPVVGTLEIGTPGPIDIVGYKFGGSVVISSGTGGTRPEAGTPSFTNFSITKAIDATTPTLAQWIVTGHRLPTVTISIGSDGGKSPSAVYTLTNAQLTHIGYDATQFGDTPSETVVLTFEEVCVATGGTERCWNVLTNKGS
jgi:type VI secretion system secreted protein Hcp